MESTSSLYRILLATILLFLFYCSCFGQEEESNIEELLLEQLAEDFEGSLDISELTEKSNYYRRHPLNLNKANLEDLANLGFLSPQQIENLIQHRQSTGSFVSLLELQSIAGFSPSFIQLFQNFVTVSQTSNLSNVSFKDIFKSDEHMFMARYGRLLESQYGYKIVDESKSRYLGDQNRYSIRYRWNFDNKIKIAFNADKDAGEPFFQNKQRYGFDFYSGNVEFNNLNKYVEKLVIGDYALQFGQGLVLWNGLSFGKSAWIGSVARQGVGLKSYTSLNESNFQRGISSKIRLGQLEWTPFIAYNSLSGKLNRSDSTENTIGTISLSGLHRTPTELSYRHQVKQFLYGANISYRYNRLKVGLTYMGLLFNGDVLRGDALRNRYDFEGKSLQQLGLSYQTTYLNYYIFGETAYSLHSGFASINGVIASFSPKFSAFATYRHYAHDYHSYYAQSLGENSSTINEQGIYAGFVFHPSRKIEWVNYIDFSRFAWLKYRVDRPSSGSDFLTQLTYNWYKRGKLTLRYRHRLKQENASSTSVVKSVLADVNKDQLRLDFQYKLNNIWTIRTRCEGSFFDKAYSGSSKGFLIYQDVFWKASGFLNLNARVAYFNTNDYDSRIYAYENDVLYASSFPVYYDKGCRSYLNARFRISRNVDLWTRYAISYFPDRTEIGSGLDKIEGNSRSDIKLQIRWQW